VKEEFPRYRSLTTVQIGDGESASFWHDHWLLDTTLAETFPALFSHCVQDTSTVRAVLTAGLPEFLRPRLTRAANEKFQMLSDYLTHIALQGGPDARLLATSKREPFTSSGAYQALQGSAPASDVTRVWAIKLPTKIKFFAWLLYHGRLNTCAHLYHGHIKPLDRVMVPAATGC
jgi:hypothetical protein